MGEEEGCMDSHAPAARRLRRVIDGAIKTCPTDSRPSKCVQASTEVAHHRNEFYCAKAGGDWHGYGSGSGSGSGAAHHEDPAGRRTMARPMALPVAGKTEGEGRLQQIEQWRAGGQ